jgi:DNA polymerase-4
MNSFIYIDVDAFFASVEQSINPALVGKPVMVGGLKHERGVVACPSYEARALGVRTGTPLHEAARLIPNGTFLRGDFSRYQFYSEKFYDILSNYSPELEKISQDEACLKMNDNAEKTKRLAKELQIEIWQSLALSTSIGIGPSRVVAKIASEHKKPMGLTIITSDNINNFLATLPIRKIPGVGHVTEKILHEMGIRTAGQLAAIPEKYLKTVFGINGLKFSAYSRGEDGIALRDYKAVRSVSRETGFADDITDSEVLLSHYYYLLGRATAKLRTLSKRAASVKIKFRYADFKTVEATARITPPGNDENAIFPIIEMIFRRTATRRLGIRFLGVTLANLKNYANNATFFDDRIEKNQRLLESLDQARDKGGYFSIVTGRTLSLSSRYKRGDTGYELRTPSLSQ